MCDIVEYEDVTELKMGLLMRHFRDSFLWKRASLGNADFDLWHTQEPIKHSWKKEKKGLSFKLVSCIWKAGKMDYLLCSEFCSTVLYSDCFSDLQTLFLENEGLKILMILKFDWSVSG